MKVRLASITPDAEQLIGYCARVSSPQNQGKDAARLLRYCVKHGHWSPFEMAHMVVEIETTRAISAQIIRHRSFSFQEFSQRYASVQNEPEPPEQRLAGATNRQSSIPVDPCGWSPEQMDAICLAEKAIADAWKAYKRLESVGIATETARNVLPLCTQTRLYMAGNIRSWLHYCQLRCTEDTQVEHRQIANAIKTILHDFLPVVASAVFGSE